MTIVPPSALPEDRELVARHLAGDPQAFRQIVERYQGMVCALAYSACGDVARSEDIAQDVFVAAWKQLPQLREPDKLRGWFGGIARNLAHNSLRRARRLPTTRAMELSPEVALEAPGPREQAIGADEAGLMWSALAGLPEIYREPMVLFYREGHSVAAVAATLDISEDTAKQRLARGRGMLTERMTLLVGETLERSAPRPAFVASVLILLPGPLSPMLLEAAETGGGVTGRTLAAAGAVGGILGKGGVVLKVLSAVAFLPALMQGAEDFIRFQDRNAAQADGGNRRQAAWAYLKVHAGIGLFCLSVVGVPALISTTSPWVLAPCALAAVGAGWMARRGKCRLNQLMPRSAATGMARGFERRSAVTVLGLPLYHFRLGTRPARTAPTIKAWIAISDGRALGGLFAFGPMALAPVGMGLVSAGILSFGVVALGGGALGILAGGWLSNGLTAIGGRAAKGVIVHAPLMASRHAHVTAGEGGAAAVQAFFDQHWFFQFTHVVAGGLMWAGLLGWVLPVALTGWQLWRTRGSKGAR